MCELFAGAVQETLCTLAFHSSTYNCTPSSRDAPRIEQKHKTTAIFITPQSLLLKLNRAYGGSKLHLSPAKLLIFLSCLFLVVFCLRIKHIPRGNKMDLTFTSLFLICLRVLYNIIQKQTQALFLSSYVSVLSLPGSRVIV